MLKYRVGGHGLVGYLILIGLALMVLERLIPDQALPKVKGWWWRVIVINLMQLAVVILGMFTWEIWLQGHSLFHLTNHMPKAVAALVSYGAITFIFYWWHRWRHDSYILWRLCHQIHHSPARIETITSFYKHPFEILVNGLLIGVINHLLFGFDLEAAGYVTLYTGLGEFFYHMNIKTPHVIGYVFQRPEMHRIHHKRGYHYQNFSDLPLWDMLFGTYHNPETYQGPCGYKPERELRLLAMLRFQDVNTPPPKWDQSSMERDS